MLLKALGKLTALYHKNRESKILALFDRDLSFVDQDFLTKLGKLLKNIYIVTDNPEQAERLSDNVFMETGIPLLVCADDNIIKTADVIFILSGGAERIRKMVSAKSMIFDTVCKTKTDFSKGCAISYFDVELPEYQALFGEEIKGSISRGFYTRRLGFPI
jgi:hypothetical protein